ncbi:MAG TPA: TolC family protein, partial [Verrucomicrobiae bacterium]|nr:TolC family protein [Verrucomicrobiae bacterium]
MELFRQGFEWRRWSVGMVAGLLLGAGAGAAEPPETMRTLSLGEAKKLAFERNWDLLAVKADVDIATAQRLVAGEFPNPNLSVLVGKIQADGHPAGTSVGNSFFNRSYDTIAAVSQLLEIGGKRSARQSSARAGIDGARARLADARRLLNLGVTKAYIAVLLADENARVLHDSSASLQREAQIAGDRLKAGDISQADRDQIQIAADRLALDAQRAEADARGARIQLEILLGEKEPQGRIAPAEQLTGLAEKGAGVESTPAGAIVGGRPDVLAARADLRKLESDLKLARAQRVPDPTVLVQYEREPPDQPNTVGFGLSFPLPVWNRNRGAINAVEAARRQAELNLQKAEAQAAAEVTLSRHD